MHSLITSRYRCTGGSKSILTLEGFCDRKHTRYLTNLLPADIRPSETPPLNQFEPSDPANNWDSGGDSLSSSYDSSYGSYTPDKEVPSAGSSGNSVGSNSPSYSNSFGSPSLDSSNSQYNPSPTRYPFTTTRSSSDHLDISSLFGTSARKHLSLIRCIER